MSVVITPLRTEAERLLAERLKDFASPLAADQALAERRNLAIAAFEKNGLPSRRVEAWKYTDLRALMRQAPDVAERPSAEEASKAQLLPSVLTLDDAALIGIVNGYPDEAPELPAGVQAIGLAEAIETGHPLADELGVALAGRSDVTSDLNLAFLRDGLILHVAEGRTVEPPIHLAFSDAGDAPFATFPRILVKVEKGASLTLIESHRGVGGIAYQSNAVVEFLLAEDAKVEHVRVNMAGDAAISLSTLGVKLGDRASFDSFNLVLGPHAARHQIFTGGPGEHIHLGLRGASLLRGQQHGDVTLHAIHAAPHGTSRELFKTVVDGNATGVFQGKIVVEPIAQKTDGRMHSAALLLSENAAMNNKPELEIFADDVQCAHGATIGALDDDMLFYAMARGIPRPEAEALLLQAFVGETIDFVSDENLRGQIAEHVRRWLMERVS